MSLRSASGLPSLHEDTMPAEALSLTAKVLLAIGVAINLIAGLWFLFASYAANARLARLAHYFPIISIRIMLENPETCLRPFILQHFGLLFCVPAILHFLRCLEAMRAGAM